SSLVAKGTIGYKHRIAEPGPIIASMKRPSFLIKIVPDVDGLKPRVCELVRYYLEDIEFKGAWASPAALELHPHVMANVAGLPVPQVVRALHYKADLTLGVGEVVYDYLAEAPAHIGGNGRAEPATKPLHVHHEGTAGA